MPRDALPAAVAEEYEWNDSVPPTQDKIIAAGTSAIAEPAAHESHTFVHPERRDQVPIEKTVRQLAIEDQEAGELLATADDYVTCTGRPDEYEKRWKYFNAKEAYDLWHGIYRAVFTARFPFGSFSVLSNFCFPSL